MLEKHKQIHKYISKILSNIVYKLRFIEILQK